MYKYSNEMQFLLMI